MQQLLFSQVMTCVEATEFVRLHVGPAQWIYTLRPLSRLHFSHTQLPLRVFAGIFVIGKSALLAWERRSGTNRDAGNFRWSAFCARIFFVDFDHAATASGIAALVLLHLPRLGYCKC